MKEEINFLNSVVILLEKMTIELKAKEEKCCDGRMLIRIGHRISAIHKVKHYIRQRIKDEDIPECFSYGNSDNFMYNLGKEDL
tara:strand:- start:351 stop:599 length:249 start_codon:yes stop_codon:yes gene_type:complete